MRQRANTPTAPADRRSRVPRQTKRTGPASAHAPERNRRAQRNPAAQRHRALQRRHANRRLAWYLGIAVMVAFDVIEWPIAIVIAVGHEIAHRARTEAVRELAEGIEAAA